MSVIHIWSDTGMPELKGSFVPFMSYPCLSWAVLCSSAKGLLQDMLNSHCAVLLFQGFLSSTATSLGSMKTKAIQKWSARPNPPAMTPCQSKSSGDPWLLEQAEEKAWTQERNRKVFTLKSFSLLEVLFDKNGYFTDCFTNIFS